MVDMRSPWTDYINKPGQVEGKGKLRRRLGLGLGLQGGVNWDNCDENKQVRRWIREHERESQSGAAGVPI
jgi:hypothetical protein